MNKIYVVREATNYANWQGFILTNKIEDADLVVFTGGADVSPSLYGENKSIRSWIQEDRDEEEVKVFNQCRALNKKMLGICRGSQLLTALSGGKLIQHVEGHALGSYHDMTTIDGDIVGTTSTHHQMHYPYNLPEDDYLMLAWSTKQLSNTYIGGNEEEMKLPENFKESEIVWYKKTNCLCIQGHPEFARMPQDGLEKCIEFLNLFMEDRLPELLNKKEDENSSKEKAEEEVYEL